MSASSNACSSSASAAVSFEDAVVGAAVVPLEDTSVGSTVVSLEGAVVGTFLGSVLPLKHQGTEGTVLSTQQQSLSTSHSGR